ncbi:MAG: glutamate-5-semialdehyde dehydrogenase [Patescibacteria group bacterium]|jgi:glutamate-5-semialdehyde dehydrogenase
MNLTKQLVKTKQASRIIAGLTTQQKNLVLKKLSLVLVQNTTLILRANKKDISNLPVGYTMLDRLTLTESRIKSMADGLINVIKLPDPIGEILETRTMPSRIYIKRQRVPLGVVAVIYEARPNVTIEVFSLCFKTGNAVILKGGHDAFYTNQTLIRIIHKILKSEKISPSCALMLDSSDRSLTTQLLQAHSLVDVIIPRGSNRLIQYVRATATIPVIETGAGVCHTFVERSADIKIASRVIVNAKTRRPSVCNTLDCLVVEQVISKKLYAVLLPKLIQHQVLIKADQFSFNILKKIYPKNLLELSDNSDYGKEFLALTLSIKTVPSFQTGFDFIQKYTSGHSEALITQNKIKAKQFQEKVDAAAVYVNTSTAFTDGAEFGLGAEIGISTQKLHARGPMGLVALTTYKWLVNSAGAIRQP